MERLFSGRSELPIEGNFPSLGGATAWFNSPPLDSEGLRGKVVAIDFCTYTCINWLRSLPYVRAWDERYRSDGLVTIGVHTPEFSFEHDTENIRRALHQMRVGYPIAIDNDYAVWKAFSNNYWPALYLIDAEGHIRHHQFGEGEYERSEMVIQRLLADANGGDPARGLVEVDPLPAEVAADWGQLRSPETYLGYAQTRNLASPGGILPDQRQTYDLPRSLDVNDWALSGAWTVGAEAAVLDAPNGRIAFAFHARDVHLVMAPSSRVLRVAFRVFLDGRAPGADGAIDVDDEGVGELIEPRLYQLIRQRGAVEDRTFEIEFLDAGARAVVFTFG